MTFFRADLHCHTNCSDGTATTEELIHLAKASDLNGLSITDHDTIAAYQVAIPLAKELGVELISGAEFSAVQEGISVHILAYSFYLESPAIANFCSRHRERRLKRNQAILVNLAKHQMPVEEAEIQQIGEHVGNSTIGRVHIALAMVKRGYVTSINDAFKRFLGEGKSCFAPGESFTVQETLDVIHEAKGFAIIAHPHLIDHEKTIMKLGTMDFDGLEGFYANFTPDKNQRWIKIAEKNQWLITGGSDFHGTVKPSISLGASWVPEETFRLLQERYLDVNPRK